MLGPRATRMPLRGQKDYPGKQTARSRSSDYDRGYEWHFKPFDAGDDFEKMARLLRRLARAPRLIVVYGRAEGRAGPKRPASTAVGSNRPNREHFGGLSPRAWLAASTSMTRPSRQALGAPERYLEAAIFIRDHVLPGGIPRLHDDRLSPSARTGLMRSGRCCGLPHVAPPPRSSVSDLPILKCLGGRGDLKAVHGVGDSGNRVNQGMPIYDRQADLPYINMSDPIPPQMWAALVRERKDRVEFIADRFTGCRWPAIVERKLKIGLGSNSASSIPSPAANATISAAPVPRNSDGWRRTVVF